ncbi:MAG: radical SAM protein [Acidobacteria bacterium]|nr:radical SAM protein [Acidobacteriota bacterium]
MRYRHLFGPVPSRRLGASLGVDLVPHKVCSMDCVYCECGPTTRLTVDRAEYVPTTDVLSEIDDCLGRGPLPDFVTFSGSGEPTLHSGIGTVIRHLKDRWKAPVALLTNATLMPDPAVRRDLLPLDLVVPSLDAALPDSFARVNRPHPDVRCDGVIDGLAAFRREYAGPIWLEVFVVDPVNTGEADLAALQGALDRIHPDRVQINSLDRPGTETWVRKTPLPVLEALAAKLRHPRVEIISRFRERVEYHAFRDDVAEAILETVSRRPCTLDDLSVSLGLHALEARKYLDILEAEKRLRAELGERGVFYRLNR